MNILGLVLNPNKFKLRLWSGYFIEKKRLKYKDEIWISFYESGLIIDEGGGIRHDFLIMAYHKDTYHGGNRVE